ncbi:signal peptide peptidase SppA [Erythrobacter litoralis]|uniref:signal peptide peptidase SppA n=1 Tax=Erythrobacter litoralis TaxID=39960 RepID=UPI002435DAB7|nr:signal peptide peptidase SppA [Erythrobacter litoralis]MDG6078046.1 signal peptide peptidase SppA [Erythrobacter litoralis]
MHFAGKVWRLLVGIKDGLVLLLMLLFFWALFAILTSRPSPAEVREGALLLKLDGVVVEERSEIDPLSALLASEAPVGEYQVRDLVHALNAAADDARIKAVVFDLDLFLGGGQVHMQEIGAAMDRVRAADKPVLTYATAYADSAMMLAAHASEVWVNPEGVAVVTGPGGETQYYAGLIERLNVNAHVFKVGEYKSAVEPYTRSSMSPEARENYAALYGALWEEWQANVKKARPKAQLERIVTDPVALVQNADGDLATAALQAGLVDKIGSKTAFEERVVALVGGDEWSELPGAYPATEFQPWLQANPYPTTGREIGVITVAGPIVDGDAGPGTAGGTRIADLLDEALARDLAGLVVRVDSPGGSVLASEEIREAIERHKAKGIPVAVSMANVAASGGYWVSTPADRIFAEPETITGSIGIFAVLPTFERTAASIGVTSDGVRTSPLSGQPDLIGGLTPEMEAVFQASIENGYRDFTSLVATSRNMTPAAVERIAQGRVWDGGSARQIGLVDQYGGMDEALAWVAGRAGLGDGEWHAAYLGRQPSATDALLRQWLSGEESVQRADVFALFARRNQAALARMGADMERFMGTSGAQAYCLGCPAPVSAATHGSRESTGWLVRLLAMVTD